MSTPVLATDPRFLQVLLVGVGHCPHLRGRDLPGALRDLAAWQDVLTRLGVPPENIWLATSAATSDAGLVAGLSRSVPAGQIDAAGTAASIEALVGAFVGRLGDDTAPRANRALVVWAGRGWTDPEGGLHLATADTAPEAHSPFGESGTYVDLMAWNDLLNQLGGRPVGVELTAVVDACFAAAGANHRTLTRSSPGVRPAELGGGRPTDVMIWAAPGGRLAAEIGSPDGPCGAASWALTQALGGEGGEDISLNSLVARAGARLFARGIEQTPAIDGPAERGERPFLSPSWDVRVSHPGEEGLGGVEISPGTQGKVYEVRVAGAASPYPLMVSTAETAQGALPKWCLYWEAPPPSASFTLVEQASQSFPTTLPSGCVHYEAKDFSTSKTSLPANGGSGYWKVVNAGSAEVGYMYYGTTSEQLVFGHTANAEFTSGATFTFIKTEALPTGANYHLAECPKKMF